MAKPGKPAGDKLSCYSMLKADRVEISRNESRKNWLIRIQIGDEVIRRYCDDPANADQDTLRTAAIKTVADEGYTIDPSAVVFT